MAIIDNFALNAKNSIMIVPTAQTALTDWQKYHF